MDGKLVKTKSSKFESYYTAESLESKHMIFDEKYNFLNNCYIKSNSKEIRTKKFLLMYNSYLRENIIKPFINNLILERNAYSIDNNIYYCQKSEINSNGDKYERTYVYISLVKNLYFKPIKFTIEDKIPLVRIIDNRDVSHVKLFMCEGLHFKEDETEMNELNSTIFVSCLDKKPNSGNNKIIERKSRFSNEINDNNSIIVKNDSNINFYGDNFSVSSISNISSHFTENSRAITLLEEKISEISQENKNDLIRQGEYFENKIKNTEQNVVRSAVRCTKDFIDKTENQITMLEINIDSKIKKEIFKNEENIMEKINRTENKMNEYFKSLALEIENLKMENILLKTKLEEANLK